jgi:hypothetical protein
MPNVVIKKKITCKGTLWQVFYPSEAPSPPMTPYFPPLHTVYVYTVYLFTRGRGEGGGELTREKVRGAIVYKAGSKIPTWLTVFPVYKL